MPNCNFVNRQLKFDKPRYRVTKTHKLKTKTQIFYDKPILIQGAFHNLIFGKTQTSFALRLFSVLLFSVSYILLYVSGTAKTGLLEVNDVASKNEFKVDVIFCICN